MGLSFVVVVYDSRVNECLRHMVEGDGECGDVPAYDEAHEEVADQPTEEDEEVEDGDGHQADLEGGVGEGEGGHCKHPAHWTAQHPVGEDDILDNICASVSATASGRATLRPADISYDKT